MPNFKLSESELKTRLDKWLYFIKHLEDFQTIPTIFKDNVFMNAFEKAALAKMGPEEMEKYQMNLKIYRDYKNTVDYAFDEGKTEGKMEGLAQGLMQAAKAAKQMGLSTNEIIKLTGLSETEIHEL